MVVLGVDLGTTFSCVSFYNPKKKCAEILENARGEYTTPSVVLFDPNEEEPLVGRDAVNTMEAYPDRAVAWIKRQMGEENPTPICISGKKYSPEEISAIILKHLVREANERLVSDYSLPATHEVVITVPAYFNDLARQRTREAGRLAGLNVLSLHNEPTSAALSYLHKNPVDKETFFMVYDLGGGTFDVSFVKVNGKEMEVLSTDGNHCLGGYDFDMILLDMVLSECEIETPIDEILKTREGMILLRNVEQMKVDLSSKTSAGITVSAPLVSSPKPPIRIQREVFEHNTCHLLDKTTLLIESTANLNKNYSFYDLETGQLKVDKVLLVGGSSRMHMVKKMLQNQYRMEPEKVVLFNPDRCVAEGAAYYALDPSLQVETRKNTKEVNDDNKEVEETPTTNSEELDIVYIKREPGSHSYGILTQKDGQPIVANIILKTDDLIVDKTIRGKFETIRDNQNKIVVSIFENSSNSELVSQNICKDIRKNAYVVLKRPVPAGTPIDIYLKRNHDGIIQVIISCDGQQQELNI